MRPHGAPVRRPVVGLTPDVESEGDAQRYVLKAAYAEAVLRAGGLPVVLPCTTDASVADACLDRVSAVVITGGAFDIPPEAYGETAREGLGPLKPARTAFETLLLRAALRRRMPVLAVCGGMQLLNVVLGGTLYQDLRRELPGAKNHEQSFDRSQPSHPVDVRDGSTLADVLGRGQLMVNSTHHQAVARLAPGLRVAAAAPDGVVEAIEATEHPFALGIQWHPELMLQTMPLQLGLYRALVHRAREARR
ncbi:MAG TPA: gamma-glutamyl-gamma-aminobutyrate hydrolase family protein [Myxococcaceae bacterium]|jgi:putative glutamine amidotransferase|nr:gamma-glutamyl-gamma-aminobutyrate hydrolase family protein [Myxococcaceae bacterium]